MQAVLAKKVWSFFLISAHLYIDDIRFTAKPAPGNLPEGGSALQILLWSLGGTVGVGTIITAFFMGPLIAYFNRKVAEPMRYGRQTGAAGVES